MMTRVATAVCQAAPPDRGDPRPRPRPARDADLPHILDIAATIANGVPGSRRTSVAGAGHMLNLDDPAGFYQALRSFLTR